MTKQIAAILTGGIGCDYTIGCGNSIEYQEKDETEEEFINRISLEYNGNELVHNISFVYIEYISVVPETIVTKYVIKK